VATVSVGSIDLAYLEQGTGDPAVLLVHGLASDAEAWAPLAEALSQRARVVSYDRRGYGGSGAPEPYVSTTVVEQAEDAAALIDALDAAGAVAVGEDLGALACLDLLVRRPDLLSAAVLLDTPLFAFVPSATEALSAERVVLEEAIRDGGPPAAVEAWLGGRGDAGRRTRAAARPGAFFADYAGLTSWPVTRRELRGIGVPVAIVDTPSAPPHVREAGDRLAELVPNVRRRADGDIAAAVEDLLGI
jgi:pimeloyl-ACP methyl ester carboxylesterase